MHAAGVGHGHGAGGVGPDLVALDHGAGGVGAADVDVVGPGPQGTPDGQRLGGIVEGEYIDRGLANKSFQLAAVGRAILSDPVGWRQKHLAETSKAS